VFNDFDAAGDGVGAGDGDELVCAPALWERIV
jgi:hypothetical protein